VTATRELYLRLLLVLAVAASGLSSAWVAVVPSAGLLLAGAAAMLASSSGRHGVAGPAVRSRLLRLLLPYWVFAAAVLAFRGRSWASWADAWRWLLPLRPAGSPDAWTAGLAVLPVWFWLLVLSPPLLWLARRWPLRVMAVPVLVLVPISVGLATGSGAVHDVLVALCTFGCCWVLGFAYADGRLVRVPVLVGVGLGSAAIALGVWVAAGPLGALLLGTGGVLLLLRAEPAFCWLFRLRRTAAVLRFLTDRVVTAVLWVGPAVAAALLLVDGWLVHPVAVALLVVAVVALGWPERLGDLRVGRRRVVRTYRFEDNAAADLPARHDVLEHGPRSDQPHQSSS
jgi:hypothetical protein